MALKTAGVCILILWSVASFATILIQDQKTFFGARVSGEYIEHFKGKMKCAYVVGWYKERKCMCFLTEADIRLKDKTLIASEPNACEGAFDHEVSPE